MNLEDTPELSTVEEGEYEVRCTDVEKRHSEKTGGDYLLLRLEIPTIPESEQITEVLMLPTENDSEKQQIRRKNAIKRAAQAFGVGISGGVETEDFIGESAWCILTEEEDEEYGMQNRVRRFVTEQ